MKNFALILTLVLAGVAGTANADKTPAPTSFDLPAIDRYISEQANEHGIVGLSVAIVRDGNLVLAKGYGKSSLEKGDTVTTNTLFAIGSITKQFACACILLLAEDGKLSVDDKVGKYFPSLTQAGEITLLDLMNHVSGYPDYYPLDFVDRRMKSPIAVDELIRQYAGGKLDFEPGTRWSYSNTGYMILGRVVEKVTGNSFGDFLEQRILRPLGLTQTVFVPKNSGKPLAQGYTSFALGPPESAQPEADGWLFSAGAIYSTASDLAKWDLALVEGKVLKPDSFKLMTAPRKLANGKLTTYGCGLGINSREGFPVLTHNGAVNGFAARNAVIPATKSAVIMLSNMDSGGGFARLHSTVLSLLAKGPATVPAISGLSAGEAAKDFFHRLQAGKLDRDQLGEEFALFMDPEKVRGAAARLKPYGRIKAVTVEESRERGGMEVTTLRLAFKSQALRALMYRTPEGRIEQFFVEKE